MKHKYYKIIERNIIYIVILVILIGFTVLYWNSKKEGFETSPDSFHKDIGSGKKLVLFYADWCGHCKTLKPEWDKAANEVNRNNQIKMIKINVGDSSNAKQQMISKRYNIEGYPTILSFDSENNMKKYDNNLDAKSLVSYCNQL